MKTIINWGFVLFLLVLAHIVYGQSDSTLTLDLMEAPNSPAANLLGISPAEVERLSDPSAILVSITNNAENIVSAPSSFAIDLAPAWVFFGHKIDFESYRKDRVLNNLAQNLVISTGIRRKIDYSTNNEYTQAAFGFRTSFLRGKLDEKFENALNRSTELLSDLSNLIAPALANELKIDTLYNSYRNKLRDATKANDKANIKKYKQLVEARASELSEIIRVRVTFANTKTKTKIDSLKLIAEKMKYRRYGWRLDLAGALAIDFPDQVFKKGKTTKSGVWLTGGFDGKKGVSIFAKARYLYNPNEIFKDEQGNLLVDDIQNFDVGARITYANRSGNFHISTELLHRSILNNVPSNDSWKYLLIIEYEVFKNANLTFSFGKDFDGTITREGNVVAALGLITGFGTKRKI